MKFTKVNPGADATQIGKEPTWVAGQTYERIDLMRALTWYNYFCDNKQAKIFLVDYMTSVNRPKDEIALVVSEGKIPNQVGWIARMLCMGYVPPPEVKERFVKEFKSILASAKKQVKDTVVAVQPVAPVHTVSIQDRIKEKAEDEVGEVEGLVDDFIASGCKSSVDVSAYFKGKNLSTVVLNRMCEFFIRKAKEFEEVMNSTDADIKEGYSNFTKVQLRKVKEFYDSLVSETNRSAVANKPIRKKRTVKEKPASAVVAKLNYLQEFAELGLKSIAPEKIIGATQVWAYNTKTKLLGVYNAENAKGLTVKGSTLQNFNVETSIGKRLRKPEVTIKELLEAGKIKLKKILSELSTKESLLTGRLNSDTIIVRVA